MRQVEFKPRASKAIIQVCDFIEGQNTPGSSVKWYNSVLTFIDKRSKLTKLKFPLCNYEKFATKGFCCFVYKKEWIVVFKYSETTLTVYRFVHGSKLK